MVNYFNILKTQDFIPLLCCVCRSPLMVPDLIELSSESPETVTRLPVDDAWEPEGVAILRSLVSSFCEDFDFGEELKDFSEELEPNMLFHSGF